jgi:hypothetical protein
MDPPEDKVQMIGGYVYTFEDMDALAKKHNIVYYGDRHACFRKVTAWLEKHRIIAIICNDTKSRDGICVILATQQKWADHHSVEDFSHRFLSTEDDLKRKTLYAELFGVNPDPPFRTVVDPFGLEEKCDHIF